MGTLIVAAFVASATATAAPGSEGVSLFTGTGDVDLRAGKMEYDRARGILLAEHDVYVRQGDQALSADRLTVRTAERDVWATGHVTYSNRTSQWTGKRLYCNLASGRVIVDGESVFRDGPFLVELGGGRRYDSAATIEGTNAVITTCAMEKPAWHYHLEARNVYVRTGEQYLAESVWVYLGGVPVLYAPYWSQNQDGTGVEVQPGYASRHGAYLLGGYKYRLDDEWMARTRLDVRSLRGVAVGEDLYGTDSDGRWTAEARAYYAPDQKPVTDAEKNAGITRDSDRYRAKVTHRYFPDGRSYLFTRINAISDDAFMEDFFRGEFRTDPRPESYSQYGRFGSNHVAGAGVRFRVNEFQETVERLPEVYLDFPRQQIPGLSVFYDGHNSAAWLRKLYPEGSATPEYSSARVDSRSTFSIIQKVGVVTFVPRAGARATWYSATPGPVDTNGVPSPEAGPGKLRTSFEVGVDASFKAFKIWSAPVDGVGGLRHVVVPFANYTYVPEPSLLPAELYQFDDVDRLSKQNVIRLGVQNKLQKRVRRRPFDLVDSRVWTDGNLEPADGAYSFNTVATDTELRPFDWMAIDFKGEYNYRSNDVVYANTHLWTWRGDNVKTDLEHRYEAGGRHLIMASAAYNPAVGYTCRYGGRWNLDGGRLEEQEIWVGRNTDCLISAVGVEHIPAYTQLDGLERPDDIRVLFAIWVKALPGAGIVME